MVIFKLLAKAKTQRKKKHKKEMNKKNQVRNQIFRILFDWRARALPKTPSTINTQEHEIAIAPKHIHTNYMNMKDINQG